VAGGVHGSDHPISCSVDASLTDDGGSSISAMAGRGAVAVDGLRRLPMMHAYLITLALLMGAATLLPAAEDRAAHEDETANASAPVATLLGGMKDFELGAQGEYYLCRGRFSVFAGVGYVVPDPDMDGLPTGAVLTGGGRIFTSGSRHRGFVELSYGPLVRGFAMQDDRTLDPVMVYGPSLLTGYQHLAKRGLTFLAAGGVGYARRADVERSSWSFELRLGVGYTWRSRERGGPAGR
jgi:hypothetical protein